MTPARKAALQWFSARGDVYWLPPGSPGNFVCHLMCADGQLREGLDEAGHRFFALTDKGRRDLHEAKP